MLLELVKNLFTTEWVLLFCRQTEGLRPFYLVCFHLFYKFRLGSCDASEMLMVFNIIR